MVFLSCLLLLLLTMVSALHIVYLVSNEQEPQRAYTQILTGLTWTGGGTGGGGRGGGGGGRRRTSSYQVTLPVQLQVFVTAAGPFFSKSSTNAIRRPTAVTVSSISMKPTVATHVPAASKHIPAASKLSAVFSGRNRSTADFPVSEERHAGRQFPGSPGRKSNLSATRERKPTRPVAMVPRARWGSLLRNIPLIPARSAGGKSRFPTTKERQPPPPVTMSLRERLGTVAPLQNVATKIKQGSFVHMVTGQGEPSPRWVQRSTWPDVTVIYLAWRQDTSAATRKFQERKFIYMFSPNTTWTTGRNKQLQFAHKLEKEQGWCFEFFLYFDEDVYFSERHESDPETIITNKSSDDVQLRLLHSLLLRDRPMRASVSYKDVASQEYPWNTTKSLECMQRCHVDHLFMAYHRTATPFLLPYDPRLDGEDWWSSAYMSNLFMATVSPKHCSYYRQVLILNDEKQTHGEYTKGSYRELFKSAKRHVQNCLGSVHFKEYRTDGDLDSFFWSLRSVLDPHAASIPDDIIACVQSKPGVDYLGIMGDEAHLFSCPIQPATHSTTGVPQNFTQQASETPAKASTQTPLRDYPDTRISNYTVKESAGMATNASTNTGAESRNHGNSSIRIR